MCASVRAAQMSIADGKERERLEVTWKNGRHRATLSADLGDMSFEIIATREGEKDGELHHFRRARPRADSLPSLLPEWRRLALSWGPGLGNTLNVMHLATIFR